MLTSDFDYHLPRSYIAQEPARPRDSSKLMVLSGRGIRHRGFSDLPDYLREGDVLAINESRVMPARLEGKKRTGGRVEVLLVNRLDERRWECLVGGKRVREGTGLVFGGSVRATAGSGMNGTRVLEFDRDIEGLLEGIGEMPTPPYIRRKLDSNDDYQTVYARHPGSIAAPTAGFHFTKEMMERIEAAGATFAHLTLHVGTPTFQPVKAKEVEEHPMGKEYCSIDAENAERMNSAERLIAGGTTCVRAIESAADKNGKIRAKSDWTDLFIYPGYGFKAPIGALLTNFHLPKSTLLMLVSAFCGRKRLLAAYEEAKRQKYRFYSFGDAMFITR